VANAHPIPDLDPADPYRVVAARVVGIRAAEVVERADGVLDVADVERLHAMRVATRRLRAALEIFEPCFAAEDHSEALAEVKGLANALGRRRDRDVAIETLEEFAEGLASADRRGIAGLVERIRAEQASTNEEIAPHVAQERLGALSTKIEALIEGQ
jgi:CHAD domain-containing protein